MQHVLISQGERQTERERERERKREIIKEHKNRGKQERG